MPLTSSLHDVGVGEIGGALGRGLYRGLVHASVPPRSQGRGLCDGEAAIALSEPAAVVGEHRDGGDWPGDRAAGRDPRRRAAAGDEAAIARIDGPDNGFSAAGDRNTVSDVRRGE